MAAPTRFWINVIIDTIDTIIIRKNQISKIRIGLTYWRGQLI